MKINDREVKQAARRPSVYEPRVTIKMRECHGGVDYEEQCEWPLNADTIDDLCDTLREVVKPKGLHIYNVTVTRQGNSGSAKFDFIHRDERHSSNNWVTREIRDFCNKTLGESKAEPDYKAALERIKGVCDRAANCGAADCQMALNGIRHVLSGIPECW